MASGVGVGGSGSSCRRRRSTLSSICRGSSAGNCPAVGRLGVVQVDQILGEIEEHIKMMMMITLQTDKVTLPHWQRRTGPPGDGSDGRGGPPPPRQCCAQDGDEDENEEEADDDELDDGDGKGRRQRPQLQLQPSSPPAV